jgi:radical SAM protein with 4Fe4S-binding SPASM domain
VEIKMIAENIINKDKRNETGEIIVTLFELCDLNCVFCNQDHNSIVGMESIVKKSDTVIEVIKHLQITKSKTEFTVNFMGGEIFSDKVPDAVFEDYKVLANTLHDYSKSSGLKIDLCFVTNFVWTKKQRVIDLLAATHADLGTSYDPAGRFNPETFEIYKQNVVEFKNYIKLVNVVLTKQNIDKFLKEQTPFFDYIYENFDVYFDHYTPEKNVNVVLPKDVDLKAMTLYMYNNWPNAYPYKNYSLKVKKNMTCMDTYTIMPDGRYGKCDILLSSSLPEKTIPIKFIKVETKSQLEEKWFADYNCLECDQFYRCSLGCFLSNHINSSRTQENCWLKEVYDYIDLKNEVKI